MKDRRIVITGMGILSCLGHTLEDVTNSLKEGKSGIGLDAERVEMGFRSTIRGILPPMDLLSSFTRQEKKNFGEAALYSAVSVYRSLEDAGLKLEDIAFREDLGLLIGNDSSASDLRRVYEILRTKKSPRTLGSATIVKSMNSTATINLNTLLKNRGLSLTISAGCASSAHAIGLGYMMIKQGLQNMCIVGGCQEMNVESMAPFDALFALSPRTDDPKAASRPFDKDRDGLVSGGGGAALILETLESAETRNAKIYAEVVGYAFSSDGGHVTQPNNIGATLCMNKALSSAGLTPDKIDYINAHATSTPEGDTAEAEAIWKVFGEKCPPVSSTKSMTGHECWMAGASESIYSILMMQGGFIAPNINFSERSPNMKPINVVNKTINKDLNIVLSNSFAFGGTNACLLFKKYN